ncbi:MAG: hypothetical protein ACO3U4_02725, partial [Gemmobacter sp.]
AALKSQAANAEPDLTASALAAIAGQNQPLPLERRPVAPIALLPRLLAAVQGLGRGTAPGLWDSLRLAQRARSPSRACPSRG